VSTEGVTLIAVNPRYGLYIFLTKFCCAEAPTLDVGRKYSGNLSFVIILPLCYNPLHKVKAPALSRSPRLWPRRLDALTKVSIAYLPVGVNHTGGFVFLATLYHWQSTQTITRHFASEAQ
jgi:hypothetical protein